MSDPTRGAHNKQGLLQILLFSCYQRGSNVDHDLTRSISLLFTTNLPIYLEIVHFLLDTIFYLMRNLCVLPPVSFSPVVPDAFS